jgi:hypothetical protein
MRRTITKFASLILTAVGISAVGVAMTTLNTQNVKAAQGPSQVQVVNGTNAAVPTVAQGTTQIAGTVAVSNSVGIDPTRNTVQLATSGENVARFSCPQTSYTRSNTQAVAVAACNLTIPAGQQFVVDNYAVHVDSTHTTAFARGLVAGSPVTFVSLAGQGAHDLVLDPVTSVTYNILTGGAPLTHLVLDAAAPLSFDVTLFGDTTKPNPAAPLLSIEAYGTGHFVAAQ